MSKYGVLLVGGNRTHQEDYAHGFAIDPRCRIIGVTDEPNLPQYRDALNRLMAAELGVPYFDHMDAALGRDDIDVLSLCPDVERRGRVGARCALARKHMYFDKPLAGSVADAEAIAAAVEKAGVHSQMFSPITAPWARSARQALDEGAVGTLLGVHADNLSSKGQPVTLPPGTVRKESERVERYTFVDAKRELFDMGFYSVCMVLWLTGKRAKMVCGVTGNYFFAEHLARDVEDFGALLLTMEDGTISSITGGRIGWRSHPRGGLQRVALVGTERTLVFSNADPHVEVYSGELPFSPPPPHPFDPMAMWRSTARDQGIGAKRSWQTFTEGSAQDADVRQFLDCLDQAIEPEMDARQGVHQVEVLMAGYASAARHAPVELRR